MLKRYVDSKNMEFYEIVVSYKIKMLHFIAYQNTGQVHFLNLNGNKWCNKDVVKYTQ